MNKVLFLLLILFSFNSLAISPEQRLKDPELESKARRIFLQVRCLVCDGQVIESSDNQFSYEMRHLIRQKVLEGISEDKIMFDLIEEFGYDIINQPKISSVSGKWFWLITIFFIFLSSFVMISFLKK